MQSKVLLSVVSLIKDAGSGVKRMKSIYSVMARPDCNDVTTADWFLRMYPRVYKA